MTQVLQKKAFDSTRWDRGLAGLEKLCEFKWKSSPTRSEPLYYEMQYKYFKKAREAVDRGDPIIAHATMVPVEIFRAMDLVPALSIFSCINMSMVLKNQVESLGISRGLGLPLEICSSHREMMAFFTEGWFPTPSFFCEMGIGCDTFGHSLRVAREHTGVPSFYVDKPYQRTERSISYLTGEFKDLIRFLEEKTGRKMDWDRLKEYVNYSRQIYETYQEIRELRKAIPSPMENARNWQFYMTGWMYAGTKEGVDWYKTLRDELKERVSQGKGCIPEEKFRFVDLFFGVGYYSLKILTWMQNTHGVNIVAEPCWSYQGKWDVDLDKPLESLARRTYCAPPLGTIDGPVENFVEAALADARDYKVDAAMWFANFTCRQNAAIRTVKDALEKKGIPTFVMGTDTQDPNYVTMDQIKEQFEGFLEILKERKK